jgi:hypothetical protein
MGLFSKYVSKRRVRTPPTGLHSYISFVIVDYGNCAINKEERNVAFFAQKATRNGSENPLNKPMVRRTIGLLQI